MGLTEEAFNWIDANAPMFVREALAKQAEGVIVKTCPDGYGTITTEQPEQEPVAVVEDWPTDKTPKGIVALEDIKELPAGTLLYASPAISTEVFTRKKVDSLLIAAYTKGRNDLLEKQAEHEIIPSWEEYCECEGISCEPVKPVDLTDDEIYEVIKRYTKTERYKDDFGSYRAVIAADREKNK